MKALVLKEVRENMKLAALGLAVHALLLVVQYRDYVASPGNMSQPLAESSMLWNTVWLGGICGAVLGWLQIFNERRPDLWAFLLHRPMTRTQILLCKTLAGLSLYALVVGAPLLCFFMWARWPGHVAAPFEWTMLRPLAACALAGVVFYFAGMVTGLRQARWYGSRALCLGAALIVCLGMLFRPVWWQGYLILLVGALLLMAAAWGAFQTHGYYRGQPALGKAALSFAAMLGSIVVACVVAALLSNLFPRQARRESWSHYAMTRDGIVAKVTERPGESAAIVDLEGQPITDATTGRKVELADLNRDRVKSFSIGVRLDNPAEPEMWIQPDISLVTRWHATSDTLWYYWSRYGRLVAYDLVTRRCIGSLGPQGFTRDLTGGGDCFSDGIESRGSKTLCTATTLYRLDVDQRTVKPLFTTPSDDPIIAAAEVRFPDSNWEYTAVTTKRSIYLLTDAGQPVWKAPYEAASQHYLHAEIFFLNSPGQFALLMAPPYWENARAGWKLPARVTWLSRDQGVIRSIDLPALPSSLPKLKPDEAMICAVLPPVGLVALPALAHGLWPMGVPREPLLLCWGAAILLCLPIGLWLGWRYHFSLAAQAGWAVFHILFGIPGLLAFLSVQEWPARLACPNCKRPRLVDRPQCEHCGADFPPPEKTGTEIFAPLVATP